MTMSIASMDPSAPEWVTLEPPTYPRLRSGPGGAPESLVSHLSQDQILELRSLVETELAALKKSMAISEEALRPVELDQTAVGRLSRIDSLKNQGMTRNLHEREKSKLAKLEAALERLGQGLYGVCMVCQAELPYGRLLVFPEAEACARCG